MIILINKKLVVLCPKLVSVYEEFCENISISFIIRYNDNFHY